jgi:multidrug efflux pump subunit AcrB
VKLKDVADVQEMQSLASVQRENQRRSLPLTVAVTGDRSVTLVADDVETALKKLALPAGISYDFSGENETIMDAFRQLIMMLLIGIILVYLVMVAQFQSLKSPFIIMFTIPLAFTGGFLALLITGIELSAISLIGFVMLVGIIVNNAIVLVAFINQLRMEGMPRREAIVEAGITRMRPILITAITTILGLVMMAIARGNGAEMMQPLAIVCIGGLIYATFMTLFVIPIIYDFFNKKELRVLSEDDLTADMDA